MTLIQSNDTFWTTVATIATTPAVASTAPIAPPEQPQEPLYRPDEETMRAFAEGTASEEEYGRAQESWMASRAEIQLVAVEYLQIEHSEEEVNQPIRNYEDYLFSIPKISVAIEENNYPRMLALMLHGADINSPTCLSSSYDTQFNPLSYAARHFEDGERILRLLLRVGARLDSEHLLNPAQVNASSAEALRILLKKYPEATNSTDKYGTLPTTGLIYSNFPTSPNLLRVLFEHGTDPEASIRSTASSNTITLIDSIAEKRQFIHKNQYTSQDKKTEELSILRQTYEVVREAIIKIVEKEKADLRHKAFGLEGTSLPRDLTGTILKLSTPPTSGRIPPPWLDEPDDASGGAEPSDAS